MNQSGHERTGRNGEDYVQLDSEDRIVRVGPALFESMSPFVGHVLWDRLPEAEALYRPYFDEARRTGQEVEFTVFYAAELKLIRATPVGSELTIHIDRIRQLDITTLETLEESLQAMTSALADRSSEQPDRPEPGSLQALP